MPFSSTSIFRAALKNRKEKRIKEFERDGEWLKKIFLKQNPTKTE
jgi:hypothetical protein